MNKMGTTSFRIFAACTFSLLLILVAGTLVFADVIVRPLPSENDNTGSMELDELIYSEDFESADHGWTLLDGYDMVTNRWRISSFAGDQGHSNSWRCSTTSPAFPDNGGYEGQWYQILRTPPIDLRERSDIQLSFDFLLRACTSNTGDGAFIMLRSELRDRLEVITNIDGTPYNTDSLGGANYAFDLYRDSMGNIPGWTGSPELSSWNHCIANWTELSVPDAEFLFVFCSDYWDDTRDEFSWTGFQLDSILVVASSDTLYIGDPDSDNSGPVFYEHGYPSTEHSFARALVEGAHSGDYALHMDTFAQRVMHVWESPWITLPHIWPDQSIRFDAWFRGEFEWAEEARDQFSFDLWVMPSDLELWYPATSPYGEDTVAICTGEPGEEWIKHSDGWDVAWDGTPYAGRQVKVRLVTRLPNVAPISFGYFDVDDFTVELLNAENDVAVTGLQVPFPTTRGLVINTRADIANIGSTDMDNINAFLQFGSSIYQFLEEPPYSLVVDETLSLSHQMYPPESGELTVSTWITCDDDQVASNDSLTITVDVLDGGDIELGHDERRPLNIAYFSRDEDTNNGPMVHLLNEDDYETYWSDGFDPNLDSVKVMCYKPPLEEWPEEIQLVAHGFTGNLGQFSEMFADTTTINWIEGMGSLFWCSWLINDGESLPLQYSSFYVWLELLTPLYDGSDILVPYIVCDPGDNDDRYYNYDGEEAVAANYDYFIRGRGHTTVSVEDGTSSVNPETISLASPWPNPFNSTTTLKVALPARTAARVEVFDVLGRKVALLMDGVMEAGVHTVTWQADHLSTGVYFARLTTGDGTTHLQKLLLVK